MVPANKILTVAYGTFSCTLEGFDDPFSTMTDIAEYFRGLAAEDRYFGAEPPTPDMAMLRQIAETTSRGSVDARSDETGVTLRPAAAPAVAADIEPQKPDASEDTDTPVEAQVAEDAPVNEVELDEIKVETIEVVEADAESAAAKLARIRDVVAADRAEHDYSEDEHAEDVSATVAGDADDETATDPSDSEDVTEQGIDALSALATEDDTVEEEDETILDSLNAEDDVDQDESDLNADLAALFADYEPEAHVEVEKPATVEDEVDAPAFAEETSAKTQPAELDEVTEDDHPETEAVSKEAPDEKPATESAAAPLATPRRVRVRKVRRAAEATAAAPVSKPAQAQPAEARETTTSQPEHSVEDPVTTAEALTPRDQAPQTEDAGDEDEAALMAELAAIEAELGRDATGATAADDDDEDDDLDEVLGALSDDPEEGTDDLMAELAAIRAVEEDDYDAEEDIAAVTDDEEAPEIEAISDEDQDEEEAYSKDEVHDVPAEAKKSKTKEPEDLERLFAATDSRLSGEDTSRRHANISHLKAAVAARRADDTMETVKTDDSGAYRKDLASTVRPRRAEKAPETRTARPERAAPLMLVSEQRVEEAPEAPAAATAEPVTPRRAPSRSDADARAEAELQAMMAARGKQTPDLGDDFEQFAQDVGATDLADVLEAAAVYSATVMGQDNFSRPRLLHLAAEAVDDLSREDGLRGFGQLLRDGTLRKVSRGTFALGTESRFREQARRLVG